MLSRSPSVRPRLGSCRTMPPLSPLLPTKAVSTERGSNSQHPPAELVMTSLPPPSDVNLSPDADWLAGDRDPPSPTESELLADWDLALADAASEPAPGDPTLAVARPASPSKTFWLDSVQNLRSEPSVPLRDLPVEIVTKIFKFAFLQPAITPASPHYPHHRATHLLRVCRAFHDICLPLFLRTVTVASPAALAALFHLEKGLLVAEEDGRRRWDLVRELCIVDGLALPFDPDDSNITDGLVPLFIPASKSLEELCYLSQAPSSAEAWNDDPDPEQLRLWNRQFDTFKARHRGSTVGDLRSRYQQYANNIRVGHAELEQSHIPPDDFNVWVEDMCFDLDINLDLDPHRKPSDILIEHQLRDKFADSMLQSNRTFLHGLIVNASPAVLRTGPHLFGSVLAHMRAPTPPMGATRGKTLLVHQDAFGSAIAGRPSTLQELSPDWLAVESVRLVGFSEQSLQDVREAIKRDRRRRWMLEKKDGTEVDLGGRVS